MEKIPENKTPIENQQEQEPTFEQQLELAKALSNAVDERNDFIKRQGGFDTFAEVGQYVWDARDSYDKMEENVSKTRQEFDKKVIDKKEFVNKLINIGENKLADRISKMFDL